MMGLIGTPVSPIEIILERGMEQMNDFKEMLKIITSTDDFLKLPIKAQILFYQLVLNSDSEGYLLNALAIERMVRASQKEYGLLFDLGFINNIDGATYIMHHNLLNGEEGGC